MFDEEPEDDLADDAADQQVARVAQAFVVGVSRPKSMHPDQTDDE